MKTAGPEGTAVVRPHSGYTTEIITEKAMTWLKEGRDSSKPFLLMMQHKAPHREWQPAPKYLDWLDDAQIPEPATLWDDYANRASPASAQAMSIGRDLNDLDLKLVPPRNSPRSNRRTGARLTERRTKTSKPGVPRCPRRTWSGGSISAT